MPETTTGHDRDTAVAQATAYVQSRFFPPLPAEYGELAVRAVDDVNNFGYESYIDLPEGLNPLPKGAVEVNGTHMAVRSASLVAALRLEHMLYDNDE